LLLLLFRYPTRGLLVFVLLNQEMFIDLQRLSSLLTQQAFIEEEFIIFQVPVELLQVLGFFLFVNYHLDLNEPFESSLLEFSLTKHDFSLMIEQKSFLRFLE
jgi:hypothetical protein